MSDMTLTNQLLMQVVDQLKVQGAKLDALGGVKPEPVRPTPRPLTGMERAKARLERLHLEQLTGEVYDAMNKWGEVQ